MAVSAASALATAVLPEAVGPTITGMSGLSAAKATLQLGARQLHDGRPAVHVVRRELAREQPRNQLVHLRPRQRLPRLDRRAAGERGGEALEPVGEPAESSARQVRGDLAQAALGVA